MAKNNLVSIIVPVYNAERFLKECVQSILDQDYKNIELILVDDGSIDNSHKICLEFADIDSRVRVFHNENHGVSFTRNFGIDAATGDYICFIDADDLILPDYITSLLQSLTRADAEIVFCGYKLLYGERLVKKAPHLKPGCYNFEDLSYRAIDDGTLSGILFGSVWGAMYKSSLIKESNVKFDPSVRRNEDGLFNLQLLPDADKIVISEYTGYIYRQWKTATAKKSEFTPSNQLYSVSDIIQQRCEGYVDVDKQLKCRSLSIIFWNVLAVENTDISLLRLSKQLKAYVTSTEFDEIYNNLNFAALNKYKKLLIGLIFKKQYSLFIILVKYIKPFLERHLKH